MAETLVHTDGLVREAVDYSILKAEVTKRGPPGLRESYYGRVQRHALTFHEALADIGLRPFSRASVDKYKAWKVKKHTPWSSWLVQKMDDHSEATAITICGIIGLSLLMSVLAFWLKSFISAEYYNLIITYGGVVAGHGALLILACGCVLSQVAGRKYKVPVWKSNTVKLDELPRHVQETVISLRERCPSLDLYIDELMMEDKVYDPFLFAQVDGQAYYLEVWDEPVFSS